ncbi:hypothetical protein KUTG_05570 [Kutzneria sp. 744]|nr:hypothetical protein KUTG_05570 [Kutzneria sp. 744]
MAVLVGGWAIGYPFALAASQGQVFLVGDPMTSKLIGYLLSLVGQYGLVCFLLFMTRPAAAARRNARLQAAPVVAVAAILVASTLTTPVGLRAAAARMPTEVLMNDHLSVPPSVGAFYFFANAYTLYAYAYGMVVAAGYVARGGERQLRWATALMAAGLTGLTLCFAVAVVANLFQLTENSAKVPAVLLVAATFAALAGIPIFIVGVAFRSVAMRLAAVGVWWRHRRAYRQLGPLWAALHEEFPEDALGRAPSPSWRDLLTLRRLHRRYYRRVIECRDGLVRISPYLAAIEGNLDSVEVIARRLPAALRAHADGISVADRAFPVVLPGMQGLDADVEQLMALSVALRES